MRKSSSTPKVLDQKSGISQVHCGESAIVWDGRSARLINRRQFLANAGIATAGLALNGPLLGCSDVTYTYIPCLGPAAAPAPVPGMTYIKASEIGCALDCSLYTGRNKHTGGRATDDAPRISAAMAAASASHPITLIIDGSALISGLFLPAGGHWSIAGLGCGTGFFVKGGTNNDGIHNGPPDAGVPGDPGPPAPPRGADVSLSNFTLNGNAGDGRSGDSTTGEVQGTDLTWFIGINLMNLDNIQVEKVVVVNTPAYHFRFSNVGHVTISGCVMQSPRPRTDCLHFDGPANDISISGCDCSTEDDAIALNCNEGYSGDISRVTITNCKLKGSSLMRLQTIGSTQKFKIDTVAVSNCTGTFDNAAFLIGPGTGFNFDAVTGLTVSGCTLTAPTVLEVGSNFGTIALDEVTFIPSGSKQAPGYAFLRTSAFFYGVTYTGASISLKNCIIQRNTDEHAAAVILNNNSIISALIFDGFTVQDGHSDRKTPNLIAISEATIGGLILEAVDSTNITNAASLDGFSNIELVSGGGVLATGWEFPDSVMANEVPYISANTGLPSIKIDGIVESYSP